MAMAQRLAVLHPGAMVHPGGERPARPPICLTSRSFPCGCRPRSRNPTSSATCRMAGNFAADYTGLICRPEAENKVIPAFARSHQADELGAPQSRQCADVRAARAAAAGLLSEGQLPLDRRSTRSTRSTGSITASARTSRCRRTGTAISTALSTNTRQKIRRLLKQVDAPGEYRITIATPETFDAGPQDPAADSGKRSGVLARGIGSMAWSARTAPC